MMEKRKRKNGSAAKTWGSFAAARPLLQEFSFPAGDAGNGVAQEDYSLTTKLPLMRAISQSTSAARRSITNTSAPPMVIIG
jgi:hypothetical protein